MDFKSFILGIVIGFILGFIAFSVAWIAIIETFKL